MIISAALPGTIPNGVGSCWREVPVVLLEVRIISCLLCRFQNLGFWARYVKGQQPPRSFELWRWPPLLLLFFFFVLPHASPAFVLLVLRSLQWPAIGKNIEQSSAVQLGNFFLLSLEPAVFLGGRQFCSQSPRTRSSGWRQCVGRSRSRSLRRWPAHLILRFICFNFCFPANFLFNWPSLVVSPRGLEHLLLAECRTNSKKRFLCITSYFVVHNGRWLRTWSNINCKIALVKFSSPMRCFHSDCSASVCLNGHR